MRVESSILSLSLAQWAILGLEPWQVLSMLGFPDWDQGGAPTLFWFGYGSSMQSSMASVIEHRPVFLTSVQHCRERHLVRRTRCSLTNREAPKDGRKTAGGEMLHSLGKCCSRPQDSEQMRTASYGWKAKTCGGERQHKGLYANGMKAEGYAVQKVREINAVSFI
jgi:hypothetical protein